MSEWGMQVRLARTARGMTQAQLADAAGTTQAVVSRVESGAVEPSTATIDRLMAALAGKPVSVRPAPSDGVIRVAGQLHELDMGQVLGTEPKPVDWIVDGVVARGALTLLAGREGQGKSLLTQALAVGIAGGRSVAGMHCAPGRVWLVDAENGEQLIHQRLTGLGLSRDAASRLRVWTAEAFDLSRDRWQLTDALDRAEHRPDLLVFDSWKTLWHGSENNPNAVTAVLNDLRSLAKAYDAGVLLIHHTTKVGDSYRGSSAIGGTVEIVYTFSRPRRASAPANLRALQCRKMRLGAEPATYWLEIVNGRIGKTDWTPDEDEETA